MTHEVISPTQDKKLIEGIALSQHSLPARTHALSDALRQIGKSPEEIAGMIKLLPLQEGEALRAFFTTLSSRAAELASAVAMTDRLFSAQQQANVELRVEQSATPRAAMTTQRIAQPIERSKIIIVTKKSKVQFDMDRLKVGENELALLYRKGGEDPERIFSSHRRQLAALQKVREIFSPEQILARDEISEERLKNASLVIAFGGDNHMQFASHYVHGAVPLLGCNSDPLTSTGALLECAGEELGAVIGKLERGEFRLDAWSRLRVSVDGTLLPSAMADLFIGESKRKYMSRHTLRIEGRSQVELPQLQSERGLEQKSSGMLVVTGAGSSGWYKSAGRYLYPQGHEFPRDAKYARFLLTEVSASVIGTDEEGRVQRTVFPPMCEGVLYEGEKLIIKSLNDSAGVIASDSLDEVSFNRGRTATIEIEKEPLWVVRL